MKTTIVVDNKQEMIEAAQAALVEGGKFAEQIAVILIDDWGANPDLIDWRGLIEMGTGHLIDCCIKGVAPTPYKEYLADRLRQYSDIGLAEMGLTRQQYQQALRSKQRTDN